MDIILPGHQTKLSEFVSRSVGVTQVDAAMIAQDEYDAFAFVARGDFARVSELPDSPRHSEVEGSRAFVALVDLRSAVSSVLDRFVDASTLQQARDLAGTVDVADVLSESLRSLSKYFTWRQSRIKTIGLAIQEPGQRTVTIDRTRNVRLGIHLDSWDKAPFDGRADARNRICVNIGSGDRYFLFVPVGMKSIVGSVADNHLPTEATLGRPVTATDIGRVFFSQSPQVPVYRLRVPPGWAYIAPTEDVPHDAQTPGEGKYDLAIHAMADFTPLRDQLATDGWKIAAL